jgi:uncharacterized membrane protein (UPF0127 family)
MKLINKKNNKILASKIKVANNFFSRSKGLLGRTKMEDEEALHIIPCSSIHSFFMKFNFDAVFLDKSNKVIHIIENMPAWRTSKICLLGHSVIELPAGVIKNTETSVGDVLEFV